MDHTGRERAERLADWLREQRYRQASQALADAFKASIPASRVALSRGPAAGGEAPGGSAPRVEPGSRRLYPPGAEPAR